MINRNKCIIIVVIGLLVIGFAMKRGKSHESIPVTQEPQRDVARIQPESPTTTADKSGSATQDVSVTWGQLKSEMHKAVNDSLTDEDRARMKETSDMWKRMKGELSKSVDDAKGSLRQKITDAAVEGAKNALKQGLEDAAKNGSLGDAVKQTVGDSIKQSMKEDCLEDKLNQALDDVGKVNSLDSTLDMNVDDLKNAAGELQNLDF